MIPWKTLRFYVTLKEAIRCERLQFKIILAQTHLEVCKEKKLQARTPAKRKSSTAQLKLATSALAKWQRDLDGFLAMMNAKYKPLIAAKLALDDKFGSAFFDQE